jgi:hypothetical protein
MDVMRFIFNRDPISQAGTHVELLPPTPQCVHIDSARCATLPSQARYLGFTSAYCRRPTSSFPPGAVNAIAGTLGSINRILRNTS